MKYKIVDNFLAEDEFLPIKNCVLYNNRFPWYLANGVAAPGDGDSYFFHEFYNFDAPMCEHFDLLVPLFRKLNVASLIRAKANLYIRGEEVVEHETHEDQTYKHSGCIIYLNTCDGYTKIADGTKIFSVENRALFFDSSTPHCSTNCTDELYRSNINVNYFEMVQ